MNLLEPKLIEINGRAFIISKYPATVGREIMLKYPLSNIPKLGDYKAGEEVMYKSLSYTAVPKPKPTDIQDCVHLSTRELLDNHVGDWETLVKLEYAILEYNCSFLQNGLISNFLSDISQNIPQWATKILTDSLQQLSRKEEQPSTN